MGHGVEAVFVRIHVEEGVDDVTAEVRCQAPLGAACRSDFGGECGCVWVEFHVGKMGFMGVVDDMG